MKPNTGFIHILERTQIVHTNLENCWTFFSNPLNLSRITPPELGFEVKSKLPEEIYSGLMIVYRVKPLWNIPITWLTEITHVHRFHYFVDEQRIGPYSIWHHEHFFKEVSPGTVEIRDIVHYRLPFPYLLEPLHSLIVQPQLQQIFEYRHNTIEKLFPPAQG